MHLTQNGHQPNATTRARPPKIETNMAEAPSITFIYKLRISLFSYRALWKSIRLLEVLVGEDPIYLELFTYATCYIKNSSVRLHYILPISFLDKRICIELPFQARVTGHPYI